MAKFTISKKLIIRIVLICAFALALFVLALCLSLPRIPQDLNAIALSTPTVIYSQSGQVVSVLSNREVVPLEQIPQHFQQAVIAMEDERFYNHHGISKRALIRAFIIDLIHFRFKQGGSTITQQLAKNLFFSFDKSWSRKLKEMLVAFQLEQQFSKDEILEAYCNQITFGSNVYGVELAAQTYFGKHTDELVLPESAMLAGIPRWPARYNPYINYDIARQRQAFVLHQMRKLGFITPEEEELAKQDSLVLKSLNPFAKTADYFIEEIKQQTAEKYGADALNYGGLRIYSTLDTRLQTDAVQAVTDGLADLDQLIGLPPYQSALSTERKKYPQAALVALDPRNGDVRAMVGGRDYRLSQFNRALSNNRHAGSAFKPVLYLAAIDRGVVTPLSVMVDEPVSFDVPGGQWRPNNFDLTFEGPMIIKYALMHSRNVISAKLISKVGPDVVIDYARRLGIESLLDPNLSLSLGTAGVSPIELASTYSAFVNNGITWTPKFLNRFESFEGKLLDTFKNTSRRAVDAQSAYLILDMLRGVIEDGTGKSVRQLGFTRPCAGKTGTSSDFKDSWFVGFTPDLIAVVWVGYDEPRPLLDKYGVGISGARGALPIWTRFMKTAHRGKPVRDFAIPPGIEYREVDPRTGSGAMPNAPSLEVAVRVGM